MPAGSRVRANNAFGTTTDNPLTAGATFFNSAALITLPAISGGQHAIIVLDPKRVFGQPEIVVVTAHTSLSTTATIVRGTYGTVAASHPVGTAWAHVAVDEDYTEILTSTSRPTDPYIGQSIFETDSMSHRFYTGSIWQSAPPIGTLLPYLGATAPDGYLFANGAAVSRTGVTADLFAVVGTQYGVGDGLTTFNLPNLQGRVPVGRDTGQAEFDVLGEIGGQKTYTITVAEMPVHSHGVTDPTHNHGQSAHGHTFSDPGHGHGLSGGNHSHAMDGDYGFRFTITVGGANNNALVWGSGIGGVQHNHGGSGIDHDFRGQEVTFSDIDHENILAPGDGGSALSVNGGGTGASVVANTANINPASTGVTTNNAGSGTPTTGNNLQPYITVNYIVKI